MSELPTIKISHTAHEVLERIQKESKRATGRKSTQPEIVNVWLAAYLKAPPPPGLCAADEKLLNSINAIDRTSRSLGRIIRDLTNRLALELTTNAGAPLDVGPNFERRADDAIRDARRLLGEVEHDQGDD